MISRFRNLSKDFLQDFMIRFTTILSSRIIKETIIGYRRRKLSMEKGTSAMLSLLKTAKKSAIPSKYVLFDSCFSSPSTFHAVKEIGYDVIGMVKKNPKIFSIIYILHNSLPNTN